MNVLGYASTLEGAVNWLFSDGRSDRFDRVAEARGKKYYITAAVDLTPVDGKIKTADLERYGVHYEGELVTVEQLKKDRIFPSSLKSDAAAIPDCFCVVVRLNETDGALSEEERRDHLVARLVYGLYKLVHAKTLQRLQGFPSEGWWAVGKERFKQQFQEDVKGCLERLKITASYTPDPEPRLDLDQIYIRAFVEAERAKGTPDEAKKASALAKLVEQGAAHLDDPRVQETAKLVAYLNRPRGEAVNELFG